AILAIVVGSAIVAIGGGGIAPMRSRIERWLEAGEREVSKAVEDAPKTAAASPPAATDASGGEVTAEPVAEGPETEIPPRRRRR
ncbi:hypothetical protein JYB64_25645, partial [Algoriphagus aestuarii]|nr:hypothetical protein [Algoriphagus aestuarii]